MNIIYTLNPYLIFVISLALLVYGSNIIIDQSKKIALKFKVSNLIIGVTIIAFGTSFPELVVGIFSSLKNQYDYSKIHSLLQKENIYKNSAMEIVS